MIHTGADALDLQIASMVKAGLEDPQILRLARLRMRYLTEPTWPPPGPPLEFIRYLAETGRIGSMDRHPSLQTIRMVEPRPDVAG